MPFFEHFQRRFMRKMILRVFEQNQVFSNDHTKIAAARIRSLSFE